MSEVPNSMNRADDPEPEPTLHEQIEAMAKTHGIPEDVAKELSALFVPLIIAIRKEEWAFCSSHFKQKAESMWAITGVHGLYTGTWLTRSAAISAHVNARLVIPCDVYATIQDGWKELKRKGDKAVKVKVLIESAFKEGV